MVSEEEESEESEYGGAERWLEGLESVRGEKVPYGRGGLFPSPVTAALDSPQY